MTQAITTPEARDASAAEYAKSWGIDPSVHAERVPDESVEGQSGDGDATSTAKADARGEYERAFDELEDAKDAKDAVAGADGEAIDDDIGEDADDGDDDAKADENGKKGAAK